mmetsp:Transcript_49194/g.115072  ORF Transcript_49194/g.115072 Transcript_49194/m.115072 type:complete len:219 (-) Transcript_49194:45-701(-)
MLGSKLTLLLRDLCDETERLSGTSSMLSRLSGASPPAPSSCSACVGRIEERPASKSWAPLAPDWAPDGCVCGLDHKRLLRMGGGLGGGASPFLPGTFLRAADAFAIALAISSGLAGSTECGLPPLPPFPSSSSLSISRSNRLSALAFRCCCCCSNFRLRRRGHIQICSIKMTTTNKQTMTKPPMSAGTTQLCVHGRDVGGLADGSQDCPGSAQKTSRL